MRPLAAALLLALSLSLTGCATNPRVVGVDANGGCVAIPSNSDAQWPGYNRSRALEVITKQCPNGFDIVKEQEIPIGQRTTQSTQRDTTQVPLAKGVAMNVQQTTRNTAEVHDETEWRIWYQKR